LTSSSPAVSALPAFEPLFRNAHVSTIAAAYWPRPTTIDRFPAEERLIETEPGVRVIVKSHRPDRKPGGEVVLVHGLESSSEAPYILSLAEALLHAGFLVHRTNIRSCGGSEHLCRTLYHAGLTTDLRAILHSLHSPAFLVGFSLGGNQVLKLAGELGSELGPQSHRLLAGAISISTPLDLLLCARKLERGFSRIYMDRFLRSMRARLARRQPQIDFRIPWERVRAARTIYDLDDCVTGPSFGFTGADHYYGTQSAQNFLNSIAVPTLIVHAADDPMVDLRAYSHPALHANPNIQLHLTRHGGHVGFLARSSPRMWIDTLVPTWIGEMFPKGR
jgi:predicted alpha/beta-fold hydrolase